MGLVLRAAGGHAEQPGTDGWTHLAPTGRIRLTLEGTVAEINDLGAQLWCSDRVTDRFIESFHDGPGEQSCPACRPHTTAPR